jgi:cobalt-zinc-cadmium efflux system protein
MEHKLNHSGSLGMNLSYAFKTGIVLNLLYIGAEVFFGFLSNSMALVADAGHNLSDVLALAFAWIGVILSQRKSTLKFTYGFRRSTILIALLNTIMLWVAVGFIVWETISRLGRPVEINSVSVIVVASIGIVVNGVTAWLFMKGQKQDLNIRSAFVHFLADTLVSLGVVVAGLIMIFTGFTRIDALVSFLIVAVILYSSFRLLVDSINLALDAVPENIDIEAVRLFLAELPEVTGMHDLHIWALSTTESALTVHLVTKVHTGFSFISGIRHQLHEKFKIGHSTIQVEFGVSGDECEINCL